VVTVTSISTLTINTVHLYSIGVVDLWACWSSFQPRQASAGSYRRGTTCRSTSYSRQPDYHRHVGTSSHSCFVASGSRILHRAHPHVQTTTYYRSPAWNWLEL